MKVKRERPTYPRTPCIAPNCRRGTTRMKPLDDGSSDQWVCGPHWRTVPKEWRQRLSRHGRRYRSAEAKGDEQTMLRAARAWWRWWDQVATMINNPGSVMSGDLPAAMVEQLRKDGLL